MTVPAGSLVTLLGLSGSGKTTLLRLVGGYLIPTGGKIFLHDRDVTALSPERRNIGMVFQNYALFPHLTARANVGFGLEVCGVPRPERQRRVDEVFQRVGLDLSLGKRKPDQLSGGQQQRVALARALVIQPDLLLLDEPFANLDRQLRDQLRAELRTVQRQAGVTTLLVTHDQEEALALSDLVAVLAEGQLLQVATPRQLYEQPRTPFLARFVGVANLFTVAHVHADRLELAEGITLPYLEARPGQVLLVRPEHCVCGTAAETLPCRWIGKVVDSVYAGVDHLLTVAIRGISPLLIQVRQRSGNPIPEPGTTLQVGFPLEAVWIVPEIEPTHA